MAEEEVIEIDLAQLKKMKVPELKRKVAELGLEAKGTKVELLARVEKYLQEQEEEEEDLLEEEEELVEGEGVDGEGVDGEGVDVEEVEEPATDANTVQKTKEAGQPPPPPDTKAGSGVQDLSVTSQQKTATPATVETKEERKPLSSLSAAERMELRAKRFGENTSNLAKKLARAQRFGTSLENSYQGLGKRAAPSGEELEKMRKRGERFGTSVSPSITQVEEDERKKKRMERFNMKTSELSTEERKKIRAQRFGTS